MVVLVYDIINKVVSLSATTGQTSFKIPILSLIWTTSPSVLLPLKSLSPIIINKVCISISNPIKIPTSILKVSSGQFLNIRNISVCCKLFLFYFLEFHTSYYSAWLAFSKTHILPTITRSLQCGTFNYHIPRLSE